MPVTTDMIRAGNPHLDEATAQYLADLWNTAYPHMRAHLTDAITGYRKRDPERSSKEDADALRRCEYLRRELGRLDKGTHRGCGRMGPSFYISSAYSLVTSTIERVAYGCSKAGDFYRLAAELADLQTTHSSSGSADALPCGCPSIDAIRRSLASVVSKRKNRNV